MRRLMLLTFLCVACLDPYQPPASSGNLNALVVDGFIASNGSASIKLSRSIPLDGKDAAPDESGATITIEASGGEIFSLHEDSPGSYSANNLSVDKTSTYTLHIKTADDNDYQSDAMKIYSTPPIDRVYWTIDAARGLEIRVDSHNTDPNSTEYYLLSGVETYEYHAPVFAHFGLKNHVFFERTPEEEIFTCYRDERTKNILASTKGLKENRVSGARISAIERTSPKISIRYSVLVKQRAISVEEYAYQQQLLVTTEQQGSLFAPIPGAVPSNVHSKKHPGEYVLGYFSAQDVQERRYNIDTFSELPSGFYVRQIPLNCQPEQTCFFPGIDLPPPGDCVSPSALSDFVGIVSVVKDAAGNPIAYIWAPGECSDCTMKGGTTKKPSFWFW